MYSSHPSNSISPPKKQILSGASHKLNVSSDSDAIESRSMPLQVFVKFPGGRIDPVDFLKIPFLADVKQSFSRHACKSSQTLQNCRFLLHGRDLSCSRPLRDGDIIFVVPRLLGGVTPRGQLDRENQEPNSQLFATFTPFHVFDEPFVFGSRHVPIT
jgi:hypothetical protein